MKFSQTDRKRRFVHPHPIAWAKAIDLYAALVQEFPDVTTYPQELGRSYNDLAIYLANVKRMPEAEKALAAAISLFLFFEGKISDPDAAQTTIRNRVATFPRHFP